MVNTVDLKSTDESLAGSSPATATLIAWAAGLFEGEGSIFRVNQVRDNGKIYSYARLELKMTDEDIVVKFQEITGVGLIHYKPSRRADWKDAWCWQLSNIYKCRQLIRLFWPYLGNRRKLQAEEAGLV